MNIRKLFFICCSLLCIVSFTLAQVDQMGQSLWLDASKGLSYEGEKLIKWEDQSKNGLFAKQGLSPGTVQQVQGWKGHQALAFDQAYLFYTAEFLVNSDYTIFIVEQRSSLKTANFFMGGRVAAKNHNLVLGYEAPTILRMAHYINDLDAPVTDSLLNRPQLSVFQFSQTEGRSIYRHLEKRQHKATTRNKTPLKSYQMAAIGGLPALNFYYKGKIYEVMMFDRALTGPERLLVSNYLIDKYDLTPPPKLSSPGKEKPELTYKPIDLQDIRKWGPHRRHWKSYFARRLATKDTIRSLTLFVDFEDAPSGDLNTEALSKKLQKTDTLNQFYHKLSRGKVSVSHQFHHQWKRMARPATAYQTSANSTGYKNMRSYVSEAMHLFPEIDYSPYDIVHVATPPNRGFKLSPTSFSLKTPTGNRVGIVSLGIDSHKARYPHKILIHEYGHQLGLPDLYPYAGKSGPSIEFLSETAVGPYDLMADLYGGWTMLGFHQYFLGWLSKEQINFIEEESWEGMLTPLAQDRGTSMVIWTKVFNEKERPLIYCIEQVNPSTNRLDLAKGVIVYSVDVHTAGGKYPVWVHRNPEEDFDDATLLPGETLNDPRIPFTVTVTGQSGDDFDVKITARKE